MSMRRFKNLFIVMLIAFVTVVAIGCGGTKIELSFEEETYSVEVTKEITLTPTVKNEKDEEYTLVFSSEDTAIATYVDGKVKGIAVGEVKVKVSLEGHEKVFAEVTVKVEPLKQHKVAFNTDGGTAVAAVDVTEGQKVTKPANPTKEGHVFVDWYKDAALTTVFDFDSAVTAAMTLYAKWELAEYNVTFDVDGGSEVEAVGVNHGHTIDEPNDPTKDGYTFIGWFSDEDLTEEFDFETEITEDTTLYAKWEVVSYTISLNLNGGTLDPTFPTTSYTVESDDITLPTPVKDGYDFIGWFTTSDFQGEAVTEIETGSTGNVILFAKYELTKYEVSFETNEGSAVSALLVTNGENAVRPADPTKDGFVFGAWFSDEDLTTIFDFNTPITEDITLYAKWMTDEEVFTVTLNWEYADKDEEVTAFLFDFFTWLKDKGIIERDAMTFSEFSGKDKTGTGVDSKFIGEYIKYIGLTGDALGLGEEYRAGSVNHLRLQGLRDSAPEIINDAYFFNSVAYHAKWVQYANWIHDETKAHTNRFWSESVGQYDMMRYLTGINAGDASYIKVEGTTNFNKGEFEMVYDYHNYSPSTLPVITKVGFEFVGWNTQADGEGDFVTALPVDAPADLELFAIFEEVVAVDADEAFIVDPNVVLATGEEYVFDGVRYEFGVNAFTTLDDAMDKMVDGYTVYLRGATYTEAMTITSPNFTLTSANGETAVIAAKITLAGLDGETVTGQNGITMTGLEFTGKGQIYAKGKIDGFVFDDNKVYDSTITASLYSPFTRADVNAFIQFYTLASENVVGDVTITNNTFDNMASDIISLDRTSVGKTITITDNEFTNFKVGAIRFDGGYNNGTYNILRNKFENDELGASAAIVFRAYSASSGNTQNINIEYNTFKNIGDVNNAEPVDTHPGSAAITTSTFNDQNVTISVKHNVFEGNVNDIHFRNTGANTGTWTANINENQFLATINRVYYETVDLADLNHNYFEDADGVAITDLEVLATLIHLNTNYSELGTKE